MYLFEKCINFLNTKRIQVILMVFHKNHRSVFIPKTFKKLEFGKAAAKFFFLEQATNVRAQCTSKDTKFIAKHTWLNSNFLSVFGIIRLVTYISLFCICINGFSSNIPVIFVHRGDSDYLEHSFWQAKQYNRLLA